MAVVEQAFVVVGPELVEPQIVVVAYLVEVASEAVPEPEESSVVVAHFEPFVAVEIPLAVALGKLGHAEEGTVELAAAGIRTGSLLDLVAVVAYFATASVDVEMAGLEALIVTEQYFALVFVAEPDFGIATEAFVELPHLERVLVEYLVEVTADLVAPSAAVDEQQNSVEHCSY